MYNSIRTQAPLAISGVFDTGWIPAPYNLLLALSTASDQNGTITVQTSDDPSNANLQSQLLSVAVTGVLFVTQFTIRRAYWRVFYTNNTTTAQTQFELIASWLPETGGTDPRGNLYAVAADPGTGFAVSAIVPAELLAKILREQRRTNLLLAQLFSLGPVGIEITDPDAPLET